mmetsp:Transcript_91408/g.263867  ORF Transcript_91408/g.263867 Transcript_91408/m.263867 type:complete len:287 (-) Transcript_91408:143-1003(-)
MLPELGDQAPRLGNIQRRGPRDDDELGVRAFGLRRGLQHLREPCHALTYGADLGLRLVERGIHSVGEMADANDPHYRADALPNAQDAIDEVTEEPRDLEHPQGVACRGGVEDDNVIAGRVHCGLGDRRDLVHPRRGRLQELGQLLQTQRRRSSSRQAQVVHEAPGVDGLQSGTELLQRIFWVHLSRPEVVAHLARCARQLLLERIPERVRRVGRQDQGAPSLIRASDGVRGRRRGLPNAPLATEEDQAVGPRDVGLGAVDGAPPHAIPSVRARRAAGPHTALKCSG